MRSLLIGGVILAAAAGAACAANSFTAAGTDFAPRHGYDWQPIFDRNVIDPSFEDGTCYDGVTWECESDNDCEWIVDLVPLGLWNYDGSHIAWLGGFCGGLATCTTSICQLVPLSTGPCWPYISWFWLAYVNDAVARIDVTLDGELVYSYELELSDHLLGYQFQTAYVGDQWGDHEICFEYHDESHCGSNSGDNYFVDLVTDDIGITAAAPGSFSTVKRLY